MRSLLYRIYNSGLGNQILSLEAGVALAALTGRELVLYGAPSQLNPPTRRDGIHYIGRAIGGGRAFEVPPHHQGRVSEGPASTVFDLFELPAELDRWLESGGGTMASFVGRTEEGHLKWLAHCVVDAVGDAEALAAFAPGVSDIIRLVAEHEDADTLHVEAETLARTARLLFVRDETRESLRPSLRALVPKSPYLELAHWIVEQLRPFHAMHLRRTDFKTFLGGGTKALTPEVVIENLEHLASRHDLLVLCTDESDDDAFFRPIREHFVSSIFLDRYILDDPEALRRFQALPTSDEIALGFVTMLVAAEAERFAGTMCSTFTSYIHRLRMQRGELDQRWLYNEHQHVPFAEGRLLDVREGPYSWTRQHPDVAHPGMAWFREWPESALLF